MPRASSVVVYGRGVVGALWHVVAVLVTGVVGGGRVLGFGVPPTVGVAPVGVVADLPVPVVGVGILPTLVTIRVSICLDVRVVVLRGGGWSANLGASSVLVSRGRGAAFRRGCVIVVLTVRVGPALCGRRDEGEGDPPQYRAPWVLRAFCAAAAASKMALPAAVASSEA